MLDQDPRQLNFGDVVALRPARPIPRQRRRKFPPRPHQLGLGAGWTRVGRCPACAHEMSGRHDCTECGAFTCKGCDQVTSINGGDGLHCARCAK